MGKVPHGTHGVGGRAAGEQGKHNGDRDKVTGSREQIIRDMINIGILIQRLRWHQRESSSFAESWVQGIDSVCGAVRQRAAVVAGWRDWIAWVKCVVAARQIWKVLCKLYLGWGCRFGSSTSGREGVGGGGGKMKMLRICARFGGFGVGVVLDLI